MYLNSWDQYILYYVFCQIFFRLLIVVKNYKVSYNIQKAYIKSRISRKKIKDNKEANYEK